MTRYGAQHLRPAVCTISEVDSARVRKLIIRLGTVIAAQRGRMQRATRDRLLAALDTAEAAT